MFLSGAGPTAKKRQAMEYIVNPNLTAITRGPLTLSGAKQVLLESAVTAAKTMVDRALQHCAQALGLMKAPGNDVYNLGLQFTAALKSNFCIRDSEMVA